MKTVLVVDDETDITGVLTEVLEEEGYRVITAHHGRAALDALRANHVDLVICDKMMPTMDGEEALRRLRADDQLSHTPVILMSAGPVDEETRTLAQAVLRKPFGLDELTRTVSALLAASQKETP